MAEPESSDSSTPNPKGPSILWVSAKFLLAVALLTAGYHQWNQRYGEEGFELLLNHRRLSEVASGALPSYVQPLLDELQERKKLFAEAEVIKYWFEYTGPLQVSFAMNVAALCIVEKTKLFEIKA